MNRENRLASRAEGRDERGRSWAAGPLFIASALRGGGQSDLVAQLREARKQPQLGRLGINRPEQPQWNLNFAFRAVATEADQDAVFIPADLGARVPGHVGKPH
jgi:hypothetical protein